MLVLTRKSKQSIMVGDEIEISVLGISGQKVRLGIEAPRSVPVLRKEVYVEAQCHSMTPGQDSQAQTTLNGLNTHE